AGAGRHGLSAADSIGPGERNRQGAGTLGQGVRGVADSHVGRDERARHGVGLCGGGGRGDWLRRPDALPAALRRRSGPFRGGGRAEGINALGLLEMLLAAPQDSVVTEVAADLVGRVEQARDFSKEWGVGAREWLEFRQGRFDRAAALWPKACAPPKPASPIVARISKSDYRRALIAFRGALSLARLGRADEARQAYADGIKHLGRAPTAEQPRDLGKNYVRWYLADAHRREAEQALKANGIAIPESPSQPQ